MRRKLTLNNITQPDPGGYQVRVVRRGKETSRYFSHRLWGGKRKALAAANNWRDQVKIALKNRTRRLSQVSTHNKSTGVLGVSRTQNYDNRKDLTYLIYSVSWVDHTGKKRNKTFSVGNIEHYDKAVELKAFEAAKQFRKDWEYHADHDTLHLLDPQEYRNWRDNE
jgi:hypothetical protein